MIGVGVIVRDCVACDHWVLVGIVRFEISDAAATDAIRLRVVEMVMVYVLSTNAVHELCSRL